MDGRFGPNFERGMQASTGGRIGPNFKKRDARIDGPDLRTADLVRIS